MEMRARGRGGPVFYFNPKGGVMAGEVTLADGTKIKVVATAQGVASQITHYKETRFIELQDEDGEKYLVNSHQVTSLREF